MITIGYVRRSKKSEEKTVSLETQRDAIGQYCDRQGFDLIDFVSDDGVSGTDRSRFDALDEAVKRHGASCVVYYHQDRIARDVGLGDYFKSLRKRGVEVHEAAGVGKVDIKTATGRMIVNIRASVDAAYAEIIGEKTAAALETKRKTGRRYTNIPPIGFVYVYDYTDEKGKQHFSMDEEPEEQRGLIILRECAKVGLGARRALAVLEARGYTGRKSLKGIHQALTRIKAERGADANNQETVLPQMRQSDNMV